MQDNTIERSVVFQAAAWIPNLQLEARINELERKMEENMEITSEVSIVIYNGTSLIPRTLPSTVLVNKTVTFWFRSAPFGRFLYST